LVPSSLFAVCTWLAPAAVAADVTEMPPELGVRSSLRYSGSTLNGHLVEADI